MVYRRKQWGTGPGNKSHRHDVNRDPPSITLREIPGIYLLRAEIVPMDKVLGLDDKTSYPYDTELTILPGRCRRGKDSNLGMGVPREIDIYLNKGELTYAESGYWPIKYSGEDLTRREQLRGLGDIKTQFELIKPIEIEGKYWSVVSEAMKKNSGPNLKGHLSGILV
ncbi:MAG: hypothetical protein JW727_04185 [Candidatus Aenigmarchaeota archaeon]|nr:hypothetical protein [Candidatus Aenigmarchaeota archaeon]